MIRALMAKSASRLRLLRQRAGLSLRELARILGEQPSNVNYWETRDALPRSDVLLPIANALGVTVEELLGEDAPKRVMTPAGRARLAFDKVSRLPRRQQDKIIAVVEAFVAQHETSEKAS
ncbi:MAG: helix-turn-helix domain-containing protein [Opitutaceae bacterium]